jgi:hypothetical protein
MLSRSQVRRNISRLTGTNSSAASANGTRRLMKTENRCHRNRLVVKYRNVRCEGRRRPDRRTAPPITAHSAASSAEIDEMAVAAGTTWA